MRKTKIIATLGPATQSPEMLDALIAKGLDIARLNMSHAPHDWVREVVGNIRQASTKADRHVGILMDTQGPAIRTGDLPVPLDLKPGQRFVLTVRGEKSEEEHSVDVNYENFIHDISVGDDVLLDNGQIHMRVLAKQENRIECQVLTPGKLGSRRHINLPGVKVSLPALTTKDLLDVALGLELGVDYLALSFVRQAKDLQQLRAVVATSPHRPVIVAKLEDQEAIRNLESIVRESDAIMVARGDLGIEVPYEELPIIQRRTVKMCHRLGKPVIVATHLLESMIGSPMATRAEITDVANAVYEQADAVMLSGETTVGRYPLRCMEVLERIALRTERSGGANFQSEAHLTTPRQKLIKGAVFTADELKADAIILFTRHGGTARDTACMRPHNSPIFAFCPEAAVARKLALLRGVTPMVMQLAADDPEGNTTRAIELLVQLGRLNRGQTAVVIGAITPASHLVDSVQMRKV